MVIKGPMASTPPPTLAATVAAANGFAN